jgi:hypothetical protein
MGQDILAELDAKLKQSGHDFWGWVVYRCTYKSDSEWAEFKDKLEAESRRSLDHFAATDAMLEQHTPTFVDDRERLENVTKSDVRRIFNEWVHSPEAAAEQPNARSPPPETRMSRYKFCIHVDETSLRSVLDKSDWHLNLVSRLWVPEAEQEPYEGDPDDDFDYEAEEAALTEEEREDNRLAEIWPEIEGCTEEDVGWCKVSGLVELYLSLCDERGWDLWYTRPPQLVR